MLIWFVLVGGVAIVLNSATLEWLIGDADTPVRLLEGYARWYLLLEVMSFVTIIVVLVFGIIAIIFQAKQKRNPKYREVVAYWTGSGLPSRGWMTEPTSLIVVFCGFMVFIFMMMMDINPLESYKMYKEDITAIEEGNLEEDVVFLYPDYKVKGIKKDYPETVAWYKTTGCDVYVPLFFDFTMDMEHVFEIGHSVAWNEENAAKYHITYTPNYHLVASIEVIKPGN